MRIPQNFAKSPPYICQSKVRWRFRKILWLSQNTWNLNAFVHLLSSKICEKLWKERHLVPSSTKYSIQKLLSFQCLFDWIFWRRGSKYSDHILTLSFILTFRVSVGFCWKSIQRKILYSKLWWMSSKRIEKRATWLQNCSTAKR